MKRKELEKMSIKRRKGETMQIPVLDNDFTIAEFETWKEELMMYLAELGCDRILDPDNMEPLPQDPRLDANGEELLDAHGDPISVPDKKLEKYETKMVAYNGILASCWATLYMCCKPKCISLIKGIKRNNCAEAYLKICEHFSSTEGALNYDDAVEEFESIRCQGEDSAAFEKFVSELTVSNDVLANVHGKAKSDADILLVFKKHLPGKLYEYFKQVKRLSQRKKTFNYVTALIRSDLRDDLKRKKMRMSEETVVEVSNVVKGGVTKLPVGGDVSNKTKLKRKKRKAGKGQVGAKESASFTAAPQKVPPNLKCYSCGGNHYQKDCPPQANKGAAAPQPVQQHFAPPQYYAPPPQYIPQPPHLQPFQRGGGRAPSLGRFAFRGRGWHTGGRGVNGRDGRGPAGENVTYHVGEDGYLYPNGIAAAVNDAPLYGYFVNNYSYLSSEVSMNAVDVRIKPGMFAGDSASTRTHCNDDKLFDGVVDKTKRMSIRVADNNTVSTEGVGCIGSLRNVNYTPKFGTNLLSIAELCDMGYTVMFEKHRWVVIDAVTKNVKGEGIRSGNLFWIDPKVIKPPDIGRVDSSTVGVSVAVDGTMVQSSFVASTKPANNSLTWHQRLHVSDELVSKLSKLGLVDGLRLNKNEMYPTSSICNACALAKMQRRQFRVSSVNAKPDRFFMHIVSDVEGPIHPLGINGELYAISFIEVKSNYKWIYMMKTKDQSSQKLLLFKQEVMDLIRSDMFTQVLLETRNLPDDDYTVIENKRMLTDGGKEYLGEFKRQCTEFGYHHKVTAPYTPEDNPVSERYWQSLMGLARTFLKQSSLPYKLWPYAVGHANYIFNRTLITTISDVPKTPFHWLFGVKPDFSNLRSWGCEAYAHIPKALVSTKLSDRSVLCYFIGFMKHAGHNTIIVYSPEATTPVTYVGHVVYNEVIAVRRNVNSGEPLLVPDVEVDDDDEMVVASDNDVANVKSSHNFMLSLESGSLEHSHGDSVPILNDSRPEESGQFEPFNYAPELRRSSRIRKNNLLNVAAQCIDDYQFGDDYCDDYYNSADTNFYYHDIFECHDDAGAMFVNDMHMSAVSDSNSSADKVVQPAAVDTCSGVETPSMFKHRGYTTKLSDFHCVNGKPPWYHKEMCELTFAVTNDAPSMNEVKFGRDKVIWHESIGSELQSHLLNGTWEIARIPPGRKALKHKWVFKVKMDVNGDVSKLKSRLVAAGYSQVYGIDYDETFSPVANLLSIRVFFALCAQYDLEIRQMDVGTAFLNADLTEDIYMDIPEFYDLDAELAQLPTDHALKSVPREQIKCRLKKAIYGLKQSPRKWNENIDKFLRSMGYEPLLSDPCLYLYRTDDETSLIAVYVDDILIASSSVSSVQYVVDAFNAKYKMEDKGEPVFIVGIRVTRDRVKRTIKLDQGTYIEKMLEKFRMDKCIGIGTPCDANVKLTMDMCPQTDSEKHQMSKYPYRELIGSLMYAMVGTRPDIAYAVSNLSKFLGNPGMLHWEAALRVLRYLRCSTNLGITYVMNPDDNLELVAYTDSDWAGCQDSRRSHSGGVLILAGGPVCWISKRQPSVTMSSAEAEYAACQFVCRDVIWVKGMLNELCVNLRGHVVKMFTDSTACMAIASKAIIDRKTKHIEMYYHYIKERVIEFKDIELLYVKTDDNIADVFTKALNEASFSKHVHNMLSHPL
ncbi:MAG: reverse transcriptase domain-containing protein [Flavipsychrobacter sp.]|nr:reverse transcriptase domain-containing protein [Flavipsychrobacter sp.]